MICAAINTRHSSLGTLRGKRRDATGKALVGVVEIQPWQGDGMWVRRRTPKGEGTIEVASTQTLERGLWLSGLGLMWVTEVQPCDSDGSLSGSLPHHRVQMIGKL